VTTVTTTTTATNVTTVNGLAAGVITATSIAADAITDAKVASDVTIASVTGSVGSVTGNVTVGTNNDKSGYSLSQAFPANFELLGINVSGHVGRVVLVDTTTTNSDMRGTDNAALAATALSTATWTGTLATNLGTTNTTVATNLDTTVGSRLATASYTAPANNDIAAIKAITDKIDTGLVVDGGVWQFTANMLELGPSGSGLDAAGVRAAIGLASANLDTQLIPLATGVELDSATRVKLHTDQPDYAPAKPADVNAQVLDVLTTDTFSELSAPPAAASSLKDKLTWLFMWARNKSTQTATERKLFADDTNTVVSTEGVSDNGTTYTKNEAV